LPTLKPELETKQKKEMKALKHKCTGVVDIYQVRIRIPNPSMAKPKKITRDKFLTPQNWDKLPRTN
jgi:hypothetical protein